MYALGLATKQQNCMKSTVGWWNTCSEPFPEASLFFNSFASCAALPLCAPAGPMLSSSFVGGAALGLHFLKMLMGFLFQNIVVWFVHEVHTLETPTYHPPLPTWKGSDLMFLTNQRYLQYEWSRFSCFHFWLYCTQPSRKKHAPQSKPAFVPTTFMVLVPFPSGDNKVPLKNIISICAALFSILSSSAALLPLQWAKYLLAHGCTWCTICALHCFQFILVSKLTTISL